MATKSQAASARLVAAAMALAPATAGTTLRANLPLAPPPVRGGIPECKEPLSPAGALPRHPGERLTYNLEMLGVSLGEVEVETARRGLFEGKRVTEYRAWIQPDGLVDAFLKIEGRTASLVADDAHTPTRSMTRFLFRKNETEETQQRSAGGRRVHSEGSVNGRKSYKNEAYSTPTHDFISSFLLLRRLPTAAQGCAVIYTHARVYTAWVEPEGSEVLQTPQGEVTMPRYRVRYGTSTGKSTTEVHVWFWPGKDRIPYQMRGHSRFSPVARLASVRPGG